MNWTKPIVLKPHVMLFSISFSSMVQRLGCSIPNREALVSRETFTSSYFQVTRHLEKYKLLKITPFEFTLSSVT